MAFNNQTEWRRVEQLNEIKTSQKGNPQRGVRTEKGWVTVRGAQALLARMQVGLSIEIGNLSEFTNPATGTTAWYGQLMQVGDPPKAPEPAYGAGPAEQALPDARSVINGAKPSNGKIPWLEFQLAFKAAHALALECEPDLTEEAESETALGEAHNNLLVRVDRSQARAALVNTFVIAFSNGRIEAPEVPELDDEEAPF